MSLSKHTRKVSVREQQANFNKNEINPKMFIQVLGSKSYVDELRRSGYTTQEIDAHCLHRMALYEEGVHVNDLPELPVKPDTKVENDGLSTYFHQQAKSKYKDS